MGKKNCMSHIKKSVLIREFREQVKGLKPKVILRYEKPFFEILNRVFKKKPHNVNLHIYKNRSSIEFKIDFDDNYIATIEYFIDRKYTDSTLLTISLSENDLDDIHNATLTQCLILMETMVQQKTT